ncbi:MAG: ABC transporter substrate-binding protein [Gammaproteobacteria bacterium]|nr:ABC transporter substrate-binding protein [Gammaproteobacteria bacterium]
MTVKQIILIITVACSLLILPVNAIAQNNVLPVPQRIVSIGLCTDQLLLMVARRSQIASLTTSSTDQNMSYMAEAVGDIPLNSASVEEIIPYKPDLIIGSHFAARDTTRFLRQLGYQVKLVTLPRTVEEIYGMLIRFGEWTGNQARAAAIITRMKREITDIQARYAHRPEKSTIIYSPNGYTIGSNTLENDVLKHAGFRNLSAEMGIVGFKKISLEQVIAARPDFLQLDNHVYNRNSLASRYLGHPVLNKVVNEQDHLFIPSRIRACAGPMVTEAIGYMAAKR